MRILSSLNRIISGLSGIFLAIMVLLVSIQVFYRYVLADPLSYSEELARFSMIWTVMLGSTVAFRNKTHIAVNFFVEKLPITFKNPVKLIQNILILIFCTILVIKGFQFSMQTMSQIAAASNIPVGYIVISIPLSGFIIILYTLEETVNNFFKKEKKLNS